MSFFVKKTINKKGTYLQLCESYYDPVRGFGAHRSIKPLGYVHDLIASGIEDPLEHFKQEATNLTLQKKEEKSKGKIQEINETSPERLLGYFPFKIINDSLNTAPFIKLLQTQYNFKFDIYSMMSSLIYARLVEPCSKSKTFHDVLPNLYEPINFSLSQLYDGIAFLGDEHEKIIEIYNHHIQKKFGYDTTHTYFDCTNFYFEIDQEDNLRRKGPSKENRKDPIVGLGLLLDANQIPIGMKVYPGNQSEKPVLREVVADLKSRNNITGKTIVVADKGLNCAENIINFKKQGDGYIFSKSVKMLPEIEKTWVLLNEDYTDVVDSNGELMYRYKSCVDKFPYVYKDENGNKKTINLTEKRVVSFNPSLAKKQQLEIKKQADKARDLCLSKAKRSEYGDSSKYVVFQSTNDGEITEDKVAISINNDAITRDLRLAGYNLIVTSEKNMKAKEIYDAYHNLWRIEESFKIMKSQLDARPVYLQKENSIIGHFLICYLSVLLFRCFQFHILDNKASSESIIDFTRSFKTAKISSTKHINLTKKNKLLSELATKYKLPLNSYYLSESQIKNILEFRFITSF